MWTKYRRSLNSEFEATKFVAGIWPRKHIGVIASSPGAGKTWYMLRLCVDLSVGGTIFDSLQYNEPPAKSLIFCGETGYEILSERTQAMHRPLDPNRVSVYSSVDMLKEGRTTILDDPAGWSNIQNIVKEEQPDITIFDTLISFRSEDENASKDTSRVLGKLRALADKYNMTIILMHHVRKRKIRDQNVQGSQDEIIGSSALMRYASIAFLLEQMNGVCSLRCVKSWWKKPEVFNYTIKGTENDIKVEAAYEWDNITQARLRAEKYIKNIKGYLTVKIVMEACKVSETTARVALEKLCKKKNKNNKEVIYETI